MAACLLDSGLAVGFRSMRIPKEDTLQTAGRSCRTAERGRQEMEERRRGGSLDVGLIAHTPHLAILLRQTFKDYFTSSASQQMVKPPCLTNNGERLGELWLCS